MTLYTLCHLVSGDVLDNIEHLAESIVAVTAAVFTTATGVASILATFGAAL